MGWYSYKFARQFIPSRYFNTLFKKEEGREHDYRASYSGDQWVSAGMYMRDLRAELCKCYGIIQKCASTSTHKKVRDRLEALNAFDNKEMRES